MAAPVAPIESGQRFYQFLDSSLLWIFGALLSLGLTLILAFNLLRGPLGELQAGDLALEEVAAPRTITYVSEVLTGEARQQAAAAVPDQFTPVDLGIARAQNAFARSVFAFVDVVRADTEADEASKIASLRAIEGLAVDQGVAGDLLALTAAEYSAVRDNILEILEDMLVEGVTQDRLTEARRNAALSADLDLNLAQDRVVAALAPQFIVPNIFRDDEERARLQAEAVAQVEPITRTILRDELILRVGDIVSEEDIEALTQLGLLRANRDWRQIVGAFLLAVLASSVIVLYWREFMPAASVNGRNLIIVGALLLLFSLVAKFLLATRSPYAYLLPAATFSILIAVIIENRFAVFATAVLGVLVGFIAQESLEMGVYAAAGGIMAVLNLRDASRLSALLRAGIMAGLTNVAVIAIFILPDNLALAEAFTYVLLGALNGPILSAGLALAGVFIIGSLFGVVTSLQLQELTRLDHPLLQELLRKAPGTYHHSIWVANLAEQAAQQVNANSALVRVGAFYHDVGKINRPPFFVENQDGANPHDNLDPYSSARIILSHVPDGLELARSHGLPDRLRDFIAEHHGDRVVKMFYSRALEQAAEGQTVDISRFRYKGPRPRTRETGIVQLADAIEASSTAVRPNTEEAIEKLVTAIMDEHLREGQLEDSGLTLGDLKGLKASFIKTLKGRFHMRLSYAEADTLPIEREELAAAGVAGPNGQADGRQEEQAEERADEALQS
ncbi:MAG: HD family phosphohydrolase [Candidatus Promineifilaceae bacterium]